MKIKSEFRAIIAALIALILLIGALIYSAEDRMNKLEHQIELRDSINDRNKHIIDSLTIVGKPYELNKK